MGLPLWAWVKKKVYVEYIALTSGGPGGWCWQIHSVVDKINKVNIEKTEMCSPDTWGIKKCVGVSRGQWKTSNVLAWYPRHKEYGG